MQFNDAQNGWLMPAEWVQHAATWMAFPHNQALWENSWGVTLADVQVDFARVANAIARFEPVKMVVDPCAVARARELCGANIELVELAINDSWCRDSGPSFVCHPRLGTAGVNWRFNAWGGKSACDLDQSLARRILDSLGLQCFDTSLTNEGGAIHVDGQGTLITTESVLLNGNRNPGMSKAEMEEIFARLLGVKKTIWLPGDPDYVTGDMTDGHVDGVCAFARPGALLVDATRDSSSVYAEVVRENRRALELATDAQGRRFEMLELFEASDAVDQEAEVFCASYTNFYIANGAIIMPAYGIAADDEAAATLRLAFPGREVVPVRINQLAHGGGGVHCITQQQPAWPLKG
ncbi:agmatine deiminase family protein [Pseudomonas chlororaphis]|uniref:agmatine deiminase family protein n=1 Tax=Pseudomonas chlororaphis TaxID=587753 RepID=UPI0007B351CC|nr:agmatine deiminase family protein [Pseudomonas chlororaphis]AZC48470.1 Agmatine deiminase-like protein [Pseudomonas chlororaphis subsp. piscium]AZC55037.1 Agmatine deiminase-like protein [Pseudomonas chlororaphis subsp. piscium]AZC61357.1 Agmatine deiminase-like protein [Pseudomonas chlororaphis subsp. piscium]AZC67599.1 Agmatine deiminase-like protein [Pseudomonas chlororaphis subsp. piscium]AZC73784.1 Agmatine deiminase-like protein [Pseudomonas chlororaphis subsp. piscium]